MKCNGRIPPFIIQMENIINQEKIFKRNVKTVLREVQNYTWALKRLSWMENMTWSVVNTVKLSISS